jgi:transposase
MSTAGHYPTDVSDAQWEVLEPLLPKPKWRPGGPGRKPLALRRVLKASPKNRRSCYFDHDLRFFGEACLTQVRDRLYAESLRRVPRISQKGGF